MRPLGITASQFTLLMQLAQQDGITAAGHASVDPVWLLTS
jgi:hypothetical protein